MLGSFSGWSCSQIGTHFSCHVLWFTLDLSQTTEKQSILWFTVVACVTQHVSCLYQVCLCFLFLNSSNMCGYYVIIMVVFSSLTANLLSFIKAFFFFPLKLLYRCAVSAQKSKSPEVSASGNVMGGIHFVTLPC